MKVVIQVDQDVRREKYEAGSKALRDAVTSALSEVEGLEDAAEISTKERFPLAEAVMIAGSIASLVLLGDWTYKQLMAFLPALERRLPKRIRIRIRASVEVEGEIVTADASGPAKVACAEVQKALETHVPSE